MPRGKVQKGRGKPPRNPEKTVENTLGKDSDDDHEAMDSLQASIGAIHGEIKAIRSDVKTELNDFRESFSREMKKELGEFREDVNRQLNEIATDLKTTVCRAEEAEQRVSDMEDWSAGAKDVICQALAAQESIQAKLTDLESRARRNNMRIYGIPEDIEGDSVQQFIENFIKTELSLTDTELGIQRCHRAPGPKPPQNANPRSVLIYFLEYRIKELVLRSAWKKKEVYLNGTRVYFDQDYPAEIRRCFFFDSGPVTYNSSAEAMADLKKRGMIAERDSVPGPEPPATPLERLKKISWEKVAPRRGAHGERARENLREFRRDVVDKV
ncbi:LINE-1 type transposase domain containing protein 1 [Dissostichus eleginoides]|uniref:LINE-1 type transposase domain containing protein 1 n=1 Tax=Dissostichus eleginoides TaxID=100907 RepID=A0AAD9CMU4_DISEL|nr:LINE-1 type transposase domain containing protein 1 [Dissostichus eleginoides]